jgi:hypothetical protein
LGVPLHTLLTQSVPVEQSRVFAQALHVPPQSTSVSAPFRTPSLQVASAQALPVHTPLEQSVVSVHACPAPQVAHAAPPQSMSVSVPFFTPSAHVAA